jgi:hypothetical protein
MLLKITNHAHGCHLLQIEKQQFTIDANIGDALRPIAIIGNMVAQAHWLLIVATTPNVTTKHTPNTTSIELISTMTITTRTMPIITIITPTINVCFQT